MIRRGDDHRPDPHAPHEVDHRTPWQYIIPTPRPIAKTTVFETKPWDSAREVALSQLDTASARGLLGWPAFPFWPPAPLERSTMLADEALYFGPVFGIGTGFVELILRESAHAI